MLASFSSSSKGTGAGRGRGIEGLARSVSVIPRVRASRSGRCVSPGVVDTPVGVARCTGQTTSNTHPRTSWSHRAAPCGTRQAARQPRVCPRSRPGERVGKGGGRFSHRTGEGTRFRSARRGGARTSSTRRKWSTTERSTRGCTTTSSYCPRGLTTSTLAAIVGGRVPITCGERLRRPRRFDREEKVGSGRGREMQAPIACEGQCEARCTHARSIERYHIVHAVILVKNVARARPPTLPRQPARGWGTADRHFLAAARIFRLLSTWEFPPSTAGSARSTL